ncbi:TonB-dependent receptor [Myxococcota bacterium]|nr:TonB-dependent receptor [Myxococcota bacterium]
MNLLLLIFIMSAPLPPPGTPAQTTARTPVDLDHPDYETVVVATRKKEKKFTSNRSVTVVKKKDIEQAMPRTTPEAIADNEGVYIQKTNHGGGAPVIRGMVGPGILLTLDGVRLNNSIYRSGPLQYLNLIDLYALRRLEVIRGPGSVLYGSDAMGGVVGLYSLMPTVTPGKIPLGGELFTRFNSADMGWTGHGHLSTSINGLGLLFSGTYSRFGNLNGGGDVGEQVLSGYEQQSFMGKAHYEIQSGILAGWWFSAMFHYSHIPDAPRTDKLLTKNQVYHYDNRTMMAIAKMGFTLRSLATKGVLTFSFQDFHESRDDKKYAGYLTDLTSITNDVARVRTPGVDLKTTSKLGKGVTLNYGAMMYRDFVTSTRSTWDATDLWQPASETAFPTDSTYTSWGLYALAEWEALTFSAGHRVIVTGGYRFHGVTGYTPGDNTLPDVDISMYGNVFHGGLQYLYKRTINTGVTFSQGFRAPNLSELVLQGFSGQFFHVPNYSLKGETANTMEWLTRLHLGALRLSFSTFFTFIDDIIVRVPVDHATEDNAVQNVNHGKGEIYGAEGGILVTLPRGFAIFGHMAYTHGDSVEDDGPRTPLSKIPPLFGKLGASWRFTITQKLKGLAEAYALGAGKQDRLSEADLADSRIPEGGTPAWVTLNLRAALFDAGELVPKTRLRLVVGLENLLDQKYKYHASGIYSPGRSVTVSLGGAF